MLQPMRRRLLATVSCCMANSTKRARGSSHLLRTSDAQRSQARSLHIFQWLFAPDMQPVLCASESITACFLPVVRTYVRRSHRRRLLLV